MSSYRELKVWQKSVDLAKDVYELTRLFPKSQQFSLVQQMERSAVSIANKIGFLEKANLDKQINETEEISRMLNGLKLSLKQKAA